MYPFIFNIKAERTQFDRDELYVLSLAVDFFDSIQLLSFIQWTLEGTDWQLHSYEYRSGTLTVWLKPAAEPAPQPDPGDEKPGESESPSGDEKPTGQKPSG